MPVLLLGGLTILSSTGEGVSLPTRKTALVVSILAMHGEKGISREALAETVWPDRSDGQARSSLRQALTAIRKALPSILEGFELSADLETIRLTGPESQVDAHRFEILAVSDTPQDKIRAAALYAGDFLAGIQVPNALENWVASQRERLRRTALGLADTLSDVPDLSADGSAECEALANRLLLADPAAEEAHRAIIRIRLNQGQTNAARKQLERCVDAVRRELDADPEHTTTALLSAIAAEGAPAATNVPARAEHLPPAGAPDRSRARPSVVVMPFDDLGSQDDYFADGVVEEITSALSRIREFFVIARQSAFTYKGRFVDVREVGQDLGVRYAVEGTVRRGGDRVRITVQLVETETGTQLWSDRYEGHTSDLFDLQDRIASHVAGAINPTIRASEIELARRIPPDDLHAYELVLRALPHFWAHRKEDNRIALDLFDKALSRDPRYGVAQAFKAWCHAQQACYLWAEEPGRERENAVTAADAAARNVSDHATALVAIGAAYSLATADHDLASSFIERSLAIDPNNAWGWMRKGWLKVLFNRTEGAMECFERAQALSPFDPFTFNMYFGMASAYQQLGDLPAAIELTKKGLNAGPGLTWAYRMLASYYIQAGDTRRASEALAQFMHHYPGVTMEKVRQGLPPGLIETQHGYLEFWRKAGIPER